MKRSIKNAILLAVCIAMLALATLPVYSAENDPYGVESVGCITDINVESSVELCGAVNYFTSVVTSHIQGLE